MQFSFAGELSQWDIPRHQSAKAQQEMFTKLSRWLEEFKAEFAAEVATVEEITASASTLGTVTEIRHSGRLVRNVLHSNHSYIVTVTGDQFPTLQAALFLLIKPFRELCDEKADRAKVITLDNGDQYLVPDASAFEEDDSVTIETDRLRNVTLSDNDNATESDADLQ